MYDLLKFPKMYPHFTDIIKNHFRLKKNYIKELCQQWSNELIKNRNSTATMDDIYDDDDITGHSDVSKLYKKTSVMLEKILDEL